MHSAKIYLEWKTERERRIKERKESIELEIWFAVTRAKGDKTKGLPVMISFNAW